VTSHEKKREPVEPLSLDDLRTTSLADRPSKVQVEDFGRPWRVGASFSAFLESLPNILAAADFRQAVGAVVAAVRNQKAVLLGMGAHPIKVGLNPILINAMERGILGGLAMNGACVVHDVEVALAGKTSEDVETHLDRGCSGRSVKRVN